MNYRTLIMLCLVMLLFLGAFAKIKLLSAKESDSSNRQQGSSLLFIENVGQFHESVRFSVMGASQPLWLTDDGVWLTFLGDDITADRESLSNAASIRLQFIGRSQRMHIEPFMPSDTSVSYYRGNDPARFHAGVPVWGGVRYVDLYPGIDLEITSQEGRLVQRLVANQPLNEPTMPRLRVEGAQIEDISAEQNTLHLSTPLGAFSFPLPTSEMPWQVEGQAKGADDKQMTINMPASLSLPQVAQEREQEMPPEKDSAAGDALLYGTYIGGVLLDEGRAITTDDAGDLYVVGHIQSITFPATIELYPLQHNIDAYIVKFDATSGELDYVSIFLPTAEDIEDFARDVVVDESGQAYITGLTDSPSFPTTEGAFDTTYGGGFDAFVLKIDQNGNLIYSTFLGSTDNDNGEGIAIDSAGNAYITGGTWSSDFPTTGGAYDTTHNGERDIFLTKLNPDGSALEYSTFIGGSSQEQAESMILDDDNVAYITGWTRSADLPTTAGAYDSTLGGNFDAFVLKMALTGAAPAYLTYLGGGDEESNEHEDRGYGIALDENGEAIVTGSTKSETFPATAGAYDTTYGGGTCSFAPCPDGFVAKLASNGTSLSYATYLGGSTSDQANDITMGLGGHVYIIGETDSQDFPLTSDAYDTTLEEEGQDAFVTAFDASGTALIYSSYFGGSESDDGQGIARYDLSQVYLTGKTRSADLPTSDNAYDDTITENGDFDIFAAILELPTPTTPTPTVTASATPSPNPTTPVSQTNTPTATTPATHTPTTSISQTPTATTQASMTPTPNAPASNTPSPNPSASATPSPKPSASATPTPTITGTPTQVSQTEITIGPEKGGQLNSPDGVQLNFPPNAVSSKTIITYIEQESPSTGTGNLLFAGPSFQIEATSANGITVTTFSQPFTMSLTYSDADWQKAGITNESLLNVYWWDGKVWLGLLPCPSCSHNPEDNQFIISLDHLSEFALLGQEQTLIYLPMLQK